MSRELLKGLLFFMSKPHGGGVSSWQSCARFCRVSECSLTRGSTWRGVRALCWCSCASCSILGTLLVLAALLPLCHCTAQTICSSLILPDNLPLSLLQWHKCPEPGTTPGVLFQLAEHSLCPSIQFRKTLNRISP